MDVLAFHAACASSDTPLHTALASALALVESALHVYAAPAELVLSFNGGKDSTVVLHLLRAVVARRAAAAAAAARAAGAPPPPDAGPLGGVGVVYFAGGGGARRDFGEVDAFMRATGAAHGFAVERLGGFADGLAALVARGVRGVLMGTRAGDPDAPTLAGAFSPTSPGWPPVMRVAPLLAWRYETVWHFLRGARLPVCVLYAAGFSSVGAADDSAPNAALRAAPGAAPCACAGACADGRDECAPAGCAVPWPPASPGAPLFLPAWRLADGALERAGRVGRGA